MLMRVVCAGAAFALAAVEAPRTMAKPPDLPVETRVRCQDALETTGEGLGGRDSELGSRDSVCPVRHGSAHDDSCCTPALSDRRSVAARPECETTDNDSERVQQACTPRQAQARTMFLIAERCRLNGDLEKARTCYEETHVLAPNSRYGKEAIQRLAEIEAARLAATKDFAAEEESSAGSEQEPPLDRQQQRGDRDLDSVERRHEEMLRSTVPLGVVPLNWIEGPDRDF